MDAIVERALEMPAAILIRGDLGNFADEAYIGYEVGIQQHRRFANFFRYGDSFMMYFKHDPIEIADLYQQFTQVVLPSEIAAKYWSKVLVNKEPILAERLLKTSYRLICEAATKKGRRMIEEYGALPNRFATFHTAAVELSRIEKVYLKYNDYEEPSVSFGLRPVAKFSWNRLHVRLSTIPGTPETWDILEPNRFLEWPKALKSAVESAH